MGREATADQRVWRLVDLGREMVAELDLDRVLGRIVEAAVDLTGARYGALGVLDEDRTHLARFLTVGIEDDARRRIGDLPRGRGVLGVLIAHPEPLRLDDVGDHPESFGFPVGHPPMKSFLGAPVRVGDDVFGNLYLTEKQGAPRFDEEDEHLLVALAEWAGVAIRNARRFGGVSGRRNELERAVNAFETTAEISAALAGETHLAPVLELIAKRSRAAVGARRTLIALADGDRLVVRAVAGDRAGPGVSAVVGAAGTPIREVFEAGRPQRVEGLAAGSECGGTLGASCAVLAPLRFRGSTLGVVCAVDRYMGGSFDADDERLLAAFALSAAPAVATAHTVANRELRRSLESSERERTRWARELHDDTLQDLAAIKNLLAAARRRGDADGVADAVDAAVEHLQVGIGNLRGLIADLRPAALDQLGPEAALQGLVRRSAELTGIDIRLDVDLAYERGRASTRHEADLESAIYRIIQEALTNVAKHAGASAAIVAVHEAEGEVAITVTDDGCGIQDSAPDSGFGLTGMRERAALAGGSLTVEPGPSGGTVVRAVLPVRRRPESPRPPSAHPVPATSRSATG